MSAGGRGPLVVCCDGYSRLYGAQRSLLTLYEHFHRHGPFRVHFVYIEEGELSEAMRAAGIPTTRVEAGPLLLSYGKRLLRWWNWPKAALEVYQLGRRLKRLFRELGADLLHCNSDRAGLIHHMGARLARIPHVNHIRRECDFGRLDRAMYDRADEIIWVSRRVRDQFAERHRIASVKGRVIYNGRTLSDANDGSTRAELLSEFGLPDDARIALHVGGFEESKHHESLIEAADMVRRELPCAFFMLAGEDLSDGQPRLAHIRAMVERLGLSRNVRFLGYRMDVGRLMRGADILVSSSRHEALGGALIEAMGYGLPCVATDTGGTSEIAPDGRCGLLVPRENPRRLAERAIELLRDHALRARFSRQAREHFANTFTVARCAEQTAACFMEILARRGRLPAARSAAERSG